MPQSLEHQFEDEGVSEALYQQEEGNGPPCPGCSKPTKIDGGRFYCTNKARTADGSFECPLQTAGEGTEVTQYLSEEVKQKALADEVKTFPNDEAGQLNAADTEAPLGGHWEQYEDVFIPETPSGEDEPEAIAGKDSPFDIEEVNLDEFNPETAPTVVTLNPDILRRRAIANRQMKVTGFDKDWESMSAEEMFDILMHDKSIPRPQKEEWAWMSGADKDIIPQEDGDEERKAA